MKTPPAASGVRSFLSAALLAAALPLTFTGCGSLRETMRMEGRLFVKLPPQKHRQEIVTTQDGWRFLHVVEAPNNQYDAGDWYMATHESGMDRTRTVHFTGAGYRRAGKLAPKVVKAAHTAFNVWPTAVETNPVFKVSAKREQKVAKALEAASARGPSDEPAMVTGVRKKAWSTVKDLDGKIAPAWHHGDGYGQFTAAQEDLRRSSKVRTPGGGIRIAILDNGFDNRVAALPAQMVDDAKNDFMGRLQEHSGRRPVKPGDLHASHGTATLSVLAGSEISIAEQKKKKVPAWRGELGVAPGAEVHLMAVSPWVASPGTANLAMAIDRASREARCDVISMSHGGSPTRMWADAVNAAYERGTAIFAATADYVNLPGLTMGVGIPSATVYPAAFRRAVAVGGLTSDRTSYGRTDGNYPFYGSGWYMRASYGPDRTAWTQPWNRKKRMKNADPQQVERNGILHAFPLNGWAPNVAAMEPAKKDGTGCARVKLNFGGASASTPQVAGAAALWLQKHRGAFTAKQWRSWEKAEAAYMALLASAERPVPGVDEPDLFKGAGTVRALDALRFTPASLRRLKSPALKWDKAPKDFYSGDNSISRILKIASATPGHGETGQSSKYYENFLYASPNKVDIGKARADGHPVLPQDYPSSLQMVFFNQILNEEWRKGAMPVCNCDPSLTPASKPSLIRRLLGRVTRDREYIRKRAEERAARYAGSEGL